jgi:hypothetical protein
VTTAPDSSGDSNIHIKINLVDDRHDITEILVKVALNTINKHTKQTEELVKETSFC